MRADVECAEGAAAAFRFWCLVVPKEAAANIGHDDGDGEKTGIRCSSVACLGWTASEQRLSGSGGTLIDDRPSKRCHLVDCLMVCAAELAKMWQGS